MPQDQFKKVDGGVCVLLGERHIYSSLRGIDLLVFAAGGMNVIAEANTPPGEYK
jgi:hypothetical protein